MQVFHTKSKIIITCNNRLAPYLQQEVEELGFKIKRAFSTGLELEGTINDCIPLNLNLRCASQVLYSVKAFTAENPARLYKELLEISWEELIDFAGYFSVSSTVDNETITTPLFANLKVKDALLTVSKKRRKSDQTPVLKQTRRLFISTGWKMTLKYL